MTTPEQPNLSPEQAAIIEQIISLAAANPAQNLFELNAATLYPTLYEQAADIFGGWDAALAYGLQQALAASAGSRRKSASSGSTPGESEEKVERIVDESAEWPLFLHTREGAFYTVPGTTIEQSDEPLIITTPQGAGALSGIDFLEDPSGVVVVSNQGRYFGLDVRMVPRWDGDLLDRRVQEVVHLDPDEKIIASLAREALYTSSAHSTLQKRGANRLIHITRQAKGKASLISDMTYTLDRQGRPAFLLNPGDMPVAVMVGPQKDSVFCASARGKAIHFDAQDIRTMGLQAVGVNVMKLEDDDDAVVGAFLRSDVRGAEGIGAAKTGGQVAIITRFGLGKRVEFDEFRPQSRAGAGLQLLKLDRGDLVAGAVACDPAKDLAILTSRGRLMRLPATALPRMGRPAKGNQIIELIDEEVVTAISPLPCSPTP